MNTLNLILLSLSLPVFLSYVLWIVFKFGVLKSISDSYYKLKDDQKWMFTMFQWGLAIPLMIVGSTPLMFFSGAFICFVGAAPNFMEGGDEEKVHVIGATGGIALGTASMWIDFHMWYLAIFMGLFALYTTSKLNLKPNNPLHVANWTWWIEVVAYGLILLTLIINRL